MAQELTAAEAAARLGVKRATLYAYVSRGVLHRNVSMDGRTSLFDPEEIEAFRRNRRRPSEGELDTVISTALTNVSDAGVQIRGRDLVTMVDDGMHFEDIAEWLWAGVDGALEAPRSWTVEPVLARSLAAVQAAMPAATPLIDRLRVSVSVVSGTDPMRYETEPLGVHAVTRSLVAGMVEGLPLLGPVGEGTSIANRLWPRLSGQPATAARVAALDAALGLAVDHGLATSTFGARIAASVRADPYSVVAAGLGVFGGPLHGAASGLVHRLLADVERLGDAGAAIGAAQRVADQVPGFGHAIYRNEDPRYGALMRRVSAAWSNDARLAHLHQVRDLVGSRGNAIPNIDLALGALTYLGDMTPDAGEAAFAVARTAGWIAHGIEELSEKPVRFRPRARYVGVR